MRTQFNYTLSAAQFEQAMRLKNQQMLKALPTRWLIQLLMMVLFAALGFVMAYSSGHWKEGFAAVETQVGMAAFMALSAHLLATALYSAGLKRMQIKARHGAGVATTLSLEEAGIRTTTQYGESFITWSGMTEVEEAGTVLLLQLDSVHFVPIPMNVFESDQARQEFIVHLRKQIAVVAPVRDSSVPIALSSDARDQTAPVDIASLWKIFITSLMQAFRMAVLMAVAPARIKVTWWQIPVFALFALLVSTAISLAKIGWGGQFAWYDLPMALFHLPVLMLAAIVAAYVFKHEDRTLQFAQIFLMIAFAIDLILIVIQSLFPQQNWLAGGVLGIAQFSLPSIWIATACAVALKRLLLPSLPQRMLALAICMGLIALPLGMTYRQMSLWGPAYDEEAGIEKSSLANEDNFYSQAKALARELAAVKAERKGVTDVFFVGMAGYGGQDVFMKEVDAVARLFRERFDAEGHTIRLINNNKTLAGSPIASVTSLKASLQRVAQVMNKEEDVLFLFLTSHGSEKHRFTLDLWPLKFKQLDPAQLRNLLDESGIKHRVVVVSACYSGGFINALKDDHTLVISASAADKTSFGCGNENDWTYFGEAYFNEALRNTYSFTEAFKLATSVIATREQKEKIEASKPQMALGSALVSKLALLEQQFNRMPKAAAEEIISTQTKPSSPDPVEQYVTLIYDARLAAQDQTACEANMQANGPERALEKNQNYFDGLNKTSAQWPRLMHAWNRYAETYCAKINDPQMMRHLYTQHLRNSTPAQDLAPTLNYLTSVEGRRWISTEREVSRRFSAELTQMQYDINAEYGKIYQDDLARIYKEFAAERNARGKK